MDVDVDQAGRDIQAADVDGGLGLILDAGVDSRDVAGADGDVHARVNAVGRVDDVPATQEEVVPCHQSRNFTGRPLRPDSYTPWMMATTRRPSSAVTSGGRPSRMAWITSRSWWAW